MCSARPLRRERALVQPRVKRLTGRYASLRQMRGESESKEHTRDLTIQGDTLERDDEKGEISVLRHEKERLLELLDRCDTDVYVSCGPIETLTDELCYKVPETCGHPGDPSLGTSHLPGDFF